MSKREQYRRELEVLDDWDGYLVEHSGLPGPRGNLELVGAAVELGSEAQFQHWLTFDAKKTQNAPGKQSAQEFLAVCGTVGLGKLIAQGKRKYLKTLRACASDARWRVREGTAMALQYWGDQDFGAVLDAMETWRDGNLYEQRAIAAALCEPRLLHEPANVKRVLALLDGITRDFSNAQDRKSAEYTALKKGLAYCWSVAVAASPADGKRAMGKWLSSTDPGVRAVMRENLKKDRLKRRDAVWVQASESRLLSG